ncbi:MAG TPA: ADP-ribosylglycohydrolase family protein [Pseudoneobacillus sp.]|nr:ADP-ribosylglycohydrolase family protein [Pseudoneobacillus sp.]
METIPIKQKFVLDDNYIHSVYAGVLGKVIGVRHGAVIEGWTYEQIQEKFGEINDYLHQYQKRFAADDDTNGPIFFIRVLEDFQHLESITNKEMGLTWLNYVPDGRGFFWWGGYGISSEHTAYENLKNGVMAPKSGSKEQNGERMAEQIGGQIFSEIWGLIFPDQPPFAAEYARKMSSVSHDGNGIYGGMFIAACTSSAFSEKDIIKIIMNGLSVIPEDSEYCIAIKKVIDFYLMNTENWRECFHYISSHFGYNHFPGPVHIIPNAAIVVLSLLYGEGDFSKAINICNMCGWDTDCNVGNVATIMGVRNGLDGIDWSWRKPINDFLCCSSIMGSLNMVDLPTFSLYLAAIAYRLQGLPFPSKWGNGKYMSGAKYNFELPGSTHSFQTESDHTEIASYIVNTDEVIKSGEHSLKINWEKAIKNNGYRVYLQTYYEPSDFDDSRMDPSFSPTLYPGQTISASINIPLGNQSEFLVRMFIYDRNHDVRIYSKYNMMNSNDWLELEYTIPHLDSVCIKKCGVEFTPLKTINEELVIYMDQFAIHGVPDYSVSFENERLEEWNSSHVEISQMTILRGIWTLEEGKLTGRYNGHSAECYSGHRYWKDYHFTVTFSPNTGDKHLLLFRVQGGIRSYAIGLAPNDKLAFYKKNELGFNHLKSKPYEWKHKEIYKLQVTCIGNKFSFYLNEEYQFEYEDDDILPYLDGAVGFANMNGSITNYSNFSVKGL